MARASEGQAGVSDHERFRLHVVDEAARLYRFNSSERRYHDACIAADAAVSELGGEWIVIDSASGWCVYDSRALKAKAPTRASE